MRSIHSSTRRAVDQALACATYRLPSNVAMPKEIWLATVALRYGLFECAASHALLVEAQADDEVLILDNLGEIADTVADHYSVFVLPRAPIGIDVASSWRVGEMAQLVANEYAPLAQRVPLVDLALGLAAESFGETKDRAIFSSLPFWKRAKARRQFKGLVDESLEYAGRFFARRLLDLEEVPEIALLGE